MAIGRYSDRLSGMFNYEDAVADSLVGRNRGALSELTLLIRGVRF